MITMVGQVGLFPFIHLGHGLILGDTLGVPWACWTLSGFIGGRSPVVNGPHVLVIRLSVGPAPPVSPPSPGASGGTGPRWVGLLGCWTWQ